MSGSPSITVSGLSDLKASFALLEAKEGKKIVRASLREGAKLIQQQAKANAPKRTGKLAKSIKVRGGRTKGNVVGVKVATSKKDSLFKGDEFYGGFQEHGWFTGKRIRKKKGTTQEEYRKASYAAGRHFIKGRHFLENAAKERTDAATEVFAREVRTRIKQFIETRGQSKVST